MPASLQLSTVDMPLPAPPEPSATRRARSRCPGNCGRRRQRVARSDERNRLASLDGSASLLRGSLVAGPGNEPRRGSSPGGGPAGHSRFRRVDARGRTAGPAGPSRAPADLACGACQPQVEGGRLGGGGGSWRGPGPQSGRRRARSAPGIDFHAAGARFLVQVRPNQPGGAALAAGGRRRRSA